jgi:MMP 1-O-methyltransferase
MSETTIPAEATPPPAVWDAMLATTGFMPEDEALGLYRAALAGTRVGPLLEVGTYCGRSTLLLAEAARRHGTVVVTVDHHRGSEEHQPGEGFHDPALTDPETGRVDTLPAFRRTIAAAGLEDHVVAVVATSATAAGVWGGEVGMVFIDGGHSEQAARQDLAGWAPHVAPGGLLVIHDVFEDPAEGGRPPYLIYREALDSGRFVERSATRSLRVLERVADRGDAGPTPAHA